MIVRQLAGQGSAIDRLLAAQEVVAVLTLTSLQLFSAVLHWVAVSVDDGTETSQSTDVGPRLHRADAVLNQ